MKNLVIFGLLAAVVLFGWHHFVHGYWARMTAVDFVEELRLGVDNGVIRKNLSNWHPPLPKEDLTLPPDGISQEFQVKVDTGPATVDGKTTLIYLVTFSKSAESTSPRNTRFEYRLVLTNLGSMFIPKWTVTKFHPTDRRVRHQAA